jgi:SAM-dependent methyltransferase
MTSDIDKSAIAGDAGIDPFTFGLHDAMLSGWFNNATGELMTGFPVAAGDVVVDVGCGDGGNAGFCARRGARVVLVDADAAKIEAATERLSGSPARQVDAYVTDCNPIPLPDGFATRVVCTEVLEHVEDPDALTAELVRIGRPGSLYLVTVPGTREEQLQQLLAPPQYFEKPNHVRIFEPEAFAALVEGAGLEILHRTSYGFFWSIWWLLFWQTDIQLGQGSHPSLDAWTRTWSEVLKGKDGARIKQAFDAFLPKAQVIVARKPG